METKSNATALIDGPKARPVPKGGKTLHRVPDQYLEGYLGDRPKDDRVTYATYIPRGKTYPAKKPAPAT